MFVSALIASYLWAKEQTEGPLRQSTGFDVSTASRELVAVS